MTNFDLIAEHSRWLQAFQHDSQAAGRQLEAMTPPLGQPVSDGQLQGLINQQQAWHDSMLAKYGAAAQRFQQQDLHGLAQALSHFLQDLREANAIFQQMIADRRRSQAQAQAYQQQTNTYIQDLRNQAFNQQRASWDRQNARWHANFMGYPQPGQFCSGCGRALGTGYAGWSCPFCGLAVR